MYSLIHRKKSFRANFLLCLFGIFFFNCTEDFPLEINDTTQMADYFPLYRGSQWVYSYNSYSYGRLGSGRSEEKGTLIWKVVDRINDDSTGSVLYPVEESYQGIVTRNDTSFSVESNNLFFITESQNHLLKFSGESKAKPFFFMLTFPSLRRFLPEDTSAVINFWGSPRILLERNKGFTYWSISGSGNFGSGWGDTFKLLSTECLTERKRCRN
jgi:hypothetical protein